MGKRSQEIMKLVGNKSSVDYWRKLMLHYIGRREKYMDKYKSSLNRFQSAGDLVVDAKRQLIIAKNKLKLINNRIKEVISGAKSNGISRNKLGYTKANKLEPARRKNPNEYKSVQRAAKKINKEDDKVGRIHSGFHIKPKISKKQQQMYDDANAMFQ